MGLRTGQGMMSIAKHAPQSFFVASVTKPECHSDHGDGTACHGDGVAQALDAVLKELSHPAGSRYCMGGACHEWWGANEG